MLDGERTQHLDRMEEPVRKGEEYDALVRGKLAYKIPDSMTVGKPYYAFASVTKSLSDSVFLIFYQKGHFERVDSILISSRVKVILIDPSESNFKIKPINSELQTVDDKSNTTWKWHIMPTQGGSNPLELVVSTRVTDRFGSDFRDVPAYTKTVIVNSDYVYSTKGFIGGVRRQVKVDKRSGNGKRQFPNLFHLNHLSYV